MNFSANMDTFYQGLKLMGFGMAGIFLVLILIFLSIKVLLKVFPDKK